MWTRTVFGAHVRLLAGLCSVMLACGDDEAPLECGEGTERDGEECVVSTDDAGPDDTDKDSGPSDKDAGPSDKDSGAPVVPPTITCGPGTIKSGDRCVVDSTMQLTCGDGTIPVDGKCAVAPPPPPVIESLVISQLSMRNNGELVVDDSTILQYYPVEVSIGLKYKGDAMKIPVIFALGEPADPTKTPEQQTARGFCMVGGFDVDHPGGETETETFASATFQIPEGCLNDGEDTRTVSPIILIDPDRTLGAKDQDAVTRIIPFMKGNDEDLDAKECRIDVAEGSAKGTCRVAAKIDPSPGLDFELKTLTAESSVVVLDKCPDGTDLDRPASYRCNSSIVPEFKIKRTDQGAPILDANGNTQLDLVDGQPVQTTYVKEGMELPKFVYGAADLALDLEVITYGEPDSVVSNADEAGEEQEDAVNNVLEDNGLQIRYEIRAASGPDADWRPLYLHEQGEQAKAGEEGESGQNPTNFEETDIVPSAPSYYSHGLYVEDDCGERNLDTCNPDLKPRFDIISGDLAQTTDFIVRACLLPVNTNGDEDTEIDKNPANNCKQIPVKVVRHDTSAAAMQAGSFAYNYQWADGAGDQKTLRLGWGFHSWNKVDTAGATMDNEGLVTLGSNLIGYADILKGWAKGAAYVSLVGSYYDYGLSTFGVRLWGDSRTVEEYHWSGDWSVSKELRKGTLIWAGCIPVNLEIRFAGSSGVTVDVDIIGVNAPLNPDEESESFLIGKVGASSRIGLAQLAVTPYGNMTVVAAASVSAVVARVGVAGALTLLNMRVPATGRLWWGVTQLAPVQLGMGAWADLKVSLSVMAGRIYLFAERYEIDYCSKRINLGFYKKTVSYPCGASWDTFWDYTIASWSGWTWNQTLWTSPYVSGNIP